MNKKESSIIVIIRDLLKPMGSDIEYLVYEEKLILQKNGATFGKIEDRKVYLLNDDKNFYQVETEILENPDEFLKAATKSYWISSKLKYSKS